VISAATGAGLERLIFEIGKRVQKLRARVELVVPYDKGAALSLLHKEGQILEEEFLPEGTRVVAMLDGSLHQRALKLMK
jgi:GTP-binding protein HflX